MQVQCLVLEPVGGMWWNPVVCDGVDELPHALCVSAVAHIAADFLYMAAFHQLHGMGHELELRIHFHQ